MTYCMMIAMFKRLVLLLLCSCGADLPAMPKCEPLASVAICGGYAYGFATCTSEHGDYPVTQCVFPSGKYLIECVASCP